MSPLLQLGQSRFDPGVGLAGQDPPGRLVEHGRRALADRAAGPGGGLLRRAGDPRLDRLQPWPGRRARRQVRRRARDAAHGDLADLPQALAEADVVVSATGAAGIVLTSMIEAVQREIPGRVSDPRDVVANSIGMFLGIALAIVLTLPATMRRRRERA